MFAKQLRYAPPFHFFICIVLAIVLHLALPLKKIIPYPYNLSGIVLMIMGGWLNIWTDDLFKKNKTSVKPYERSACMLTGGPFRFSRNPMYLGIAVILLGIAVFLGSVTPFAAPILFLAGMNFICIPHEEKRMAETFGQAYLDYKNRVRRWI